VEFILKSRSTGKCKVCKGEYIKRSITHKTCSVECSLIYIEKQKAIQNKRIYKEQKEKLYTLSDYRRMAQQAVNSWVRYRDRDLGCISCDKPSTWSGQWHAGHYLSRGSHPELAYAADEGNINRQCSQCNYFNPAGTARRYREGLIERIGLDKVEWLEGPHPPAKLSKDDLIAIRDDYRKRLSDAKRSNKL
jgi:hypothetical protein